MIVRTWGGRADVVSTEVAVPRVAACLSELRVSATTTDPPRHAALLVVDRIAMMVVGNDCLTDVLQSTDEAPLSTQRYY